MFTQHVVYADKINEEENQKPMRTSANLSVTIEQHNDRTDLEETQTATQEEDQNHTVEQEETSQTAQLGTQMSLTPDQKSSGPDSAGHLAAKETWIEQPQNKDDDREGETDSGEESEEYKEDPFFYESPSLEETKPDPQNAGQKKGGDTKNDNEQKGQVEEQGSSSEPEWGRRTSIDHEKELKQWQETNIRPNNKKTYRFGHCHWCNAPIATSRPTLTFTCFACRQEEQSNVRAEVRSSNDEGKSERDDEEEFYRIPIAGERDSDYEETLSDVLGDLSDSENEWLCKDNEDKQASNNIAFAIGPKVEGRVLEKNVPLLRNFLHLNPYTAIFEEIPKSLPTEVPTWSAALLQYQQAGLKQSYKRPKKKRMKLMKEIRRKIPKVDPIPLRQLSQQM
jgi:RNA polymerase-binding transcription factor DksA